MVSEEEQYRYHPYYTERPRGMLTLRERRYLAGESDIEPKSQEERSVRQSIRQHAIDSILDFVILRQHLEKRDRDMIFSPKTKVDISPQEFYERSSRSVNELRPDELGEIDSGWVSGALTELISFAYQYVNDPEIFGKRVEAAIVQAARTEGYDAQVTVDIEINKGENIENIYRRLNDKGAKAVNARELRILRDMGKIDRVEYHERALERVKRKEGEGLFGSAGTIEQAQNDQHNTDA